MPNKMDIMPKSLTAMNRGPICDALIRLLDEYGNVTGSTHNIENLVFDVQKQKHVDVNNDCVCLRNENKKEYCLGGIKMHFKYFLGVFVYFSIIFFLKFFDYLLIFKQFLFEKLIFLVDFTY